MTVIISNTMKEPIYMQIESQIKSQILDGSIKPGDQLPSIRSLAKSLEISVITVKKAYENLEASGFTYGIGGKGSFVSDLNIEMIKEKKKQQLEIKLGNIIDEMKSIGISCEDIVNSINIICEEE